MRLGGLFVVALLLAACGSSSHSRECGSECKQEGITGVCLDSPESDSRFCAYPDLAGCPESGLRWGVLAGDGLSTMCVAGADAGPTDAGMVDAPPPTDAGPADAGPYLVNGQAADVVLGQDDFDSTFENSGGLSASSLKSPTSVASDGQRLFVADKGNVRVLQWNTLPVGTKAPASLVIGQPLFTSTTAGRTASTFGDASNALGSFLVSTAGGRVVVSDPANGRVLIWSSAPLASGAPATLVLGAANFTTFGNLTFLAHTWGNAARLAVNANQCQLYDQFPSVSGEAPDHQVLDQMFPQAVTSDGTRLFVSTPGGAQAYNSWPIANDQTPDFTLFGGCNPPTAGNACPVGMTIADGKLFVADSTNARVLVFDPIPTQAGAQAKYVLGADDFTTNATGQAPSATRFGEVHDLTVAGDHLWVVSKNRVLGFKLNRAAP